MKSLNTIIIHYKVEKLFKPKGKSIKIYLSEKETKLLDKQPIVKKI